MDQLKQLKPLTYASRDLELPRVEKQGDCVIIHVRPLSLVESIVRMGVWCIFAAGLAVLLVSRVVGKQPPEAVYNTAVFLAFYANWFPLPVAMLIFCFFAYVIVRLACFGRRWSIIAIDRSGIFLDHPTAIIPSSRIPFDRLLQVRRGRHPGELPRLTQAVKFVLRDGPPSCLPVREEDLDRILEVVQSTIDSLVEPDGAAAERGQPQWSRRLYVSRLYSGVDFGDLKGYADGVRFVLTSNFNWFAVHIAVFVPLLVVSLLLLNLVVTPHPMSLFLGIVSYVVLHIVIYGQSRPTERRHLPEVILDVAGDRLAISHHDFRGVRRSWKSGEIVAIRIGGPLWRLLRVGSLYIRLADGSRVTLLTCYPVTILKKIARVLSAALLRHGSKPESVEQRVIVTGTLAAAAAAPQ